MGWVTSRMREVVGIGGPEEGVTSGNQGYWWGCGGIGGHCPEWGYLVIKGYQWGRHHGTWRTGRVRASQGLAQESGEHRLGEGAPRAAPSYWEGGSSCLQLSSPQAVCSPALGRSQCGLGCYVYPQDPAKARWLVGSSTLLSGLLFFLLLPPLLFCHMEGWSYVESFYFAFITLSTVGFGDYVIGERTLQVVGGLA